MKTNFSITTKSFKYYGLILALLTGLCAVVWAADYLGANGVLQQVRQSSAKPDKKTADEASMLRDELKDFGQTVTQLAPTEAARRWLAMTDRAVKIQRQSRRNYNPAINPLTKDEVMNVLPPPAAWGELAKAIAARDAAKGKDESEEVGLKLLAATLTGDADGRKGVILDLQTKAAKNRDNYFYQNLLQEFSEQMLAVSDDPDAILKSLEYQLSSATSRRGRNRLGVPNLVSQVGRQKAEAFLRRALVMPNVTLELRGQNETSRLAQKLALELMPQLKMPQWGLVNSLDGVDLYEAMDKRFPAQTNHPVSLPGLLGLTASAFVPPPEMDGDDNGKQQAEVYYLLSLISHDRTRDAVAIAKKLNGRNNRYYVEEAFKSMEQAGYTHQLDAFLYESLAQDPALPFWDQYVSVAAHAGQTERMVALMRSASDRQDLSELSETKKTTLRNNLFKALLAADKADEAVAEIRRQIAAETPAAAPESEDGNNGQRGALLAHLGMLLHRPEWIEEGLSVTKKWLASAANSSGSGANNVIDTTVQILFALQRGPEAEAILKDALAAMSRVESKQRNYYGGNPPTQQILEELAALYHQAGRYPDVVTLLEKSPDWGARDVSDLFDSSAWGDGVSVLWLHTGASSLSVSYLAANALLATGQKEPAQKITTALLNQNPGSDRGYELLLALEGTNAIPRLDELFARDQFEERPLIWKAHLLRGQNRLEEAEKLLRQAINIDPSDGEEGRGDRMRVYAELAEVRAARGDQKEAEFFREVVKAIRLSEDADQFYYAGLLKRAVAMYEEALNHFSDAYCIQSRLAIQLSALGMNEAAEEHYRRAFELMPDSFGRVESHCFGCEKAFDGERAQSLAEKVFTKLAEERPDKPQIHYLLGYLRGEEERYNEARTNYLTAVRLDPDYLNAWVRLSDISRNVLMSPQERDNIVFNILRLDPLQRHNRPSFENVSNLAGLWTAVAAAASHQIPVATNLFALPASKMALETAAKSSDDQSFEMRMMRNQWSENTYSPAAAIGQTPFVKLAGQMVFSQADGGDEF